MNDPGASESANSTTDASESTPQRAYRSRSRRFSPSMGWPAFWSEIIIVLLGVLIALAANEAVQEWNWHSKVKDAEARLKSDITWVFLWSAEKSVSQPCVDAQLEAMSRNVLESSDALRPLAVMTSLGREQVVRMSTRPWRFPTWEALLGDGTASHFSPRRQAILGRVSEDAALARAYEAETRALGGALLVMRHPIPLDPAVRTELLTRINALRSVWQHERLSARQRMRMIADAGDAPSDEVIARFLNVDGKFSPGNAHSGTPYYCLSNGLPLGDWRDYQQVSVSMDALGASLEHGP